MCDSDPPRLALLVRPPPDRGDDPYWVFGDGPFGDSGHYRIHDRVEPIEPWQLVDQLLVDEYFLRQRPRRTSLFPAARVRYVDQAGTGRLGSFLSFDPRARAALVRAQCGGDPIAVPLHSLRVPTGHTLLDFPALHSPTEILYRYSVGDILVYDSKQLAALAGRCPPARCAKAALTPRRSSAPAGAAPPSPGGTAR